MLDMIERYVFPLILFVILCVVILVIISKCCFGRRHGVGHGRKITMKEEGALFSTRAEAGYEEIQCHIPASLINFINNKVVPNLNGQRMKEDQFAVLILSQRSIDNIQETWLRNKLYHKLVDKSFISFPSDDDHLVNYIVARPDQSSSPPLHAEKILLNRFDVLKEKFPVSSVSTVLLYSWLMPCSGCTQRIIQKFKNSPYKVVIAYNSDWTKAITEDKNEENRNKLREAGIDVYQVRYQSTLPSV